MTLVSIFCNPPLRNSYCNKKLNGIRFYWQNGAQLVCAALKQHKETECAVSRRLKAWILLQKECLFNCLLKHRIIAIVMTTKNIKLTEQDEILIPDFVRALLTLPSWHFFLLFISLKSSAPGFIAKHHIQVF